VFYKTRKRRQGRGSAGRYWRAKSFCEKVQEWVKHMQGRGRERQNTEYRTTQKGPSTSKYKRREGGQRALRAFRPKKGGGGPEGFAGKSWRVPRIGQVRVLMQ